jgi:rubrerythrin
MARWLQPDSPGITRPGSVTASPRDSYDPSRDRVAPLLVRPIDMELIWVCGDCGEHYPRTLLAPETCFSCGAPRQHFYGPAED